MAGVKRKLEEFDVSEVACKECSKATVHGVVTELSPIKKSKKDESRKYFIGAMSDGKHCVRVVSFEPSLRVAMDESMCKKEAISVVDCQVRRGLGGESEVLMSSVSKVQPSPKKFDCDKVSQMAKKESVCVQVVDVCSIAVKQLVTVQVKVKSVDPVEKVKNKEGIELEKQDCVVGDVSGCCRVVLWEKDVGRLKEGQSYKLVGAGVRSFRGSNYLSVGDGCQIEDVGDIGEIADVEEGELQEKGVVRKVIEGEIDGVAYDEEYEGCIGCGAKVRGEDELIGECTKCGMVMKRKKCTKFLTARVSIESSDGKRHMVTMFNKVIMEVIEGIRGDNLKRKLLSAPMMRFNVDKGDVVYSVQKL